MGCILPQNNFSCIDCHNPTLAFHDLFSLFHNLSPELHNLSSEFHNLPRVSQPVFRISQFHFTVSKYDFHISQYQFHNPSCKFHNPTSKFHNSNCKIRPPSFTIRSPSFTVDPYFAMLRGTGIQHAEARALIDFVGCSQQISGIHCSMQVQKPPCCGCLMIKHMNILTAVLDGLQFHFTSYCIANFLTLNLKQQKTLQLCNM